MELINNIAKPTQGLSVFTEVLVSVLVKVTTSTTRWKRVYARQSSHGLRPNGEPPGKPSTCCAWAWLWLSASVMKVVTYCCSLITFTVTHACGDWGVGTVGSYAATAVGYQPALAEEMGALSAASTRQGALPSVSSGIRTRGWLDRHRSNNLCSLRCDRCTVS